MKAQNSDRWRRTALWALAAVLACAGACSQILGLDQFEPAPTCGDGLKNGNESDLDCGGSCPACQDLKGCTVGSDCASLVCIGNTCRAPACDDGVHNGNEIDVDCGGPCNAKCGPDRACGANADCIGGICTQGFCAPTCNDGEKSGDETDVECGGSNCPPCDVGQGCLAGHDCQTGVCESGHCLSNHVLSKRFGDAPDNQIGVDIAIDANDDILVTGNIVGGIDFGCGNITSAGTFDAFVTKFNSSGTCVWSKKYGDSGAQFGTDIAVDSFQDIIVGGNFTSKINLGIGGPMELSSAGSLDIFLAKLDLAGTHVWSKSFGDIGLEAGSVIAVHPSGEVALTMRSSGTVDFGGGPLQDLGNGDVFVAKFDAAGNYSFGKRFGDGAAQYATGIAIDDAGQVVIAGAFAGTLNFGGNTLTSTDFGPTDIFLAKLSSTGNHVFSASYGDSAEQESDPALVVDDMGNMILAGKFAGSVDFGGGPMTSVGQNDVFLVKLDPNGGHIFSKRFDWNGATFTPYLAVDPQGDILLSGSFDGSMDLGGGLLESAGNSDAFLAKFDASGMHLWSRRFGDTQTDGASAAAVDSMGDVVLTGSFMGTIDFGGGPLVSAGGSDIFLVKLRLP